MERIFLNIFKGAQVLLLGVMTLVFVFQAQEKLEWRMEHDGPLFHYAAFLMDEYGAVPYKDIFETSMPGTFILHYAIVSIFGCSAFGFQLVDLMLLLLLMSAAYFFMNRFGRLPAWGSALIFGLLFLGFGRMMSLQRDYIGLVFVFLAFACIPSKPLTRKKYLRYFLAGSAFGLAMLFKPHLLLGLPIVFISMKLLFSESPADSSGLFILRSEIPDIIRAGLVILAGVLTPIVPVLIWLAIKGAFADFLKMCFSYLPLYSALTGGHETIAGWSRVQYILSSAIHLGGFGLLVLLGLFGIYRALVIVIHDKFQRISAFAIFSACIIYALYPVFAGKFWPYHYCPMIFFLTLSSSFLLLLKDNKSNSDINEPTFSYLVAVVAFFLTFNVYLDFPGKINAIIQNEALTHGKSLPKAGRVDEIAIWLKMHLKEGDTVQPLDWTGGAVHAMLLARARLATRYMYDYYFYHHTSKAFIQDIRQHYIQQLRKSPPRFFIEVETDTPRVTGKDTSRDFPELISFIQSDYRVIKTGYRYAILERITRDN